MKKIIKKIFVFVLMLVFVFSPISYSGLMNFDWISHAQEMPDDLVWSEDIVIESSFVYIPSGHKLIIKEGVNVRFADDYVSMRIDGELIVEGTKDNPVVFESDYESGESFCIYANDASNINIKGAEIIGGGMEFFLVRNFINKSMAANYCGAINVDRGANVVIEDTTFRNNRYALLADDLFDGSLRVNYSKFIDNEFDVEDNNYSDFRYNWWGSPDGVVEECIDTPYGQSCTSKSYGNFIFEPWQTEEDFSINEGASNVLFLPGIKASRLYDKSESTCPYDADNKELVWEPNCNEDVRRLYLNSDGKSLSSDIYTKEGDVIDETPIGSNIYKSFIEKMDGMKNTDNLINDWKPISYDWRLSLDDILEDGFIENELRNLADNSKTKKVTIVAHSNGGLLTKALLHKLGDEETEKLVDKIIFVAVPQVGTPEVIAGLLHGENQGLFPVFSTKNARGFAENMSSAYNLLPSVEYFSTIETPVVSFDIESESSLNNRYPDEIDSYNDFYEFIADDFNRVSAACSEVDIPAKLNLNLLEKSKDLHEDLDSWTPPEGIDLIQIAGWGVPETLSKTEYENVNGSYCDEGMCVNGLDVLDPDFKFTIDGDGVVVSPSALWMSGGERYWVDLDSYNIFLIRNIDHANILEIPELNSFIADSITNQENPIYEYEYISTEVPPSSDKKRLQYSLHSPLTLGLYDDEGRHTGINSGGQIEEQIPGTYFRQFGDVKYIFADEDISSYIEMKGYDDGKFTFVVEEFIGDESINKITFKDMPVTPQTKVSFEVPGNLESASSLEIDEDGDDENDFSLQPKIGEIVIFDEIAPVTDNLIEGTKGDKDWYTSDVELSFSATDNESGSSVIKTEYSLDNGETWIEYENSISFYQEGIFSIKYFSTDSNGNAEETKEAIIKIDKTAPEGKLSFNTKTQNLDVSGIDNLSENVSTIVKEEKVVEQKQNNKKSLLWFLDNFRNRNKGKILTTTTLVDEAGHKTEIIWEDIKDKSENINISIVSIYYDGNESNINKGVLQYSWLRNWKGKYLFLASHINTDSLIIYSHYLLSKDETWILERSLKDNNNYKKHSVWKKMQGMVIPSIITDMGELKINY